MSDPYRVQGYVHVPEALLAVFRRELPEHIALTRAEPGCISFEVVPRADDPATYDVREAFVDHAAFLAHQTRAAAAPWAAATAGIERHYDLPARPAQRD